MVVPNDERVEPRFGIAVPAAIGELLAEQSRDDTLDVLAEIGSERDSHAVDARLHLALEEGLIALLPSAVLPDERDRAASLVTTRVEPEVAQQQQAVGGRSPGLSLFGVLDPRREVGAAVPLSVVTLQREEAGAPALGGDASPLGEHLLLRRVRQVAQDLPADRGVRVEQPGERFHRLTLAAEPRPFAANGEARLGRRSPGRAGRPSESAARWGARGIPRPAPSRCPCGRTGGRSCGADG